ncbi:MAG: efflux RND transporter permease subunit [Treponema sp.]|jgi:multidrug efflux pump subunit AcrB|nr:efflux RND transporter permease subunit [Treponema sp.]
MEDERNMIMNWFRRPVAAFCVCLCLLIISFYALSNQKSLMRDDKNTACMITLTIYGTDARDMERIAAIPLEDALSALPGINRIVTFSENSRVRAFVAFHRNAKNTYNAVREAAQRIYETMPPWTQKPVLSASDESGIPVWAVAVMGTVHGDYLEKVIKPALEGLDGVGEVEIAGSGITEIIIAPDLEKTAVLGLSSAQIAMSLSMNDGKFRGGRYKLPEKEFIVKVDGAYTDSVSIADAWIRLDSGKAIQLKDIAAVYEQEREEEVFSRLDGEKVAVISVQAASGADLRTLSARIKKELKKFSDQSLEFKILRDSGAEEEKAYLSVLTATLFAAILVALCTALMIRNYGGEPVSVLICALSIPFIAILSIALLSCLGFPVNRKLLAGLSIGIGAAADAVILCADGFGRKNASFHGTKTIAKLMPPLVSGAATTIAALFPLARFSEADDMTAIAWALGAVTVVSLAVSVFLLPPLFLKSKKNINQQAFTLNKPRGNHNLDKSRVAVYSMKHLVRKGKRLIGKVIALCLRKPLLCPVLAIMLTALGGACLFFTGVDVSQSSGGNSIFARIEFEGGFHRAEGDKLMAVWAEGMMKTEGVVSVQTSVRTGSAQIIVNFDQDKTKDKTIRNMIRSSMIPEAFVYIPEAAEGEQSWEISISGDDDEQCRKLAEQAASLCSGLLFVKDTVLNFKHGNPRLTLSPDRDRLAVEGLWFSAAADTVRRSVHGPVIYKRPGEKGETDVRLKNLSVRHQTEIENIYTLPLTRAGQPHTTGISRFDQVFTGTRDNEPSMIRREDRRRTASFSIRTASMDPRKAREKINEAIKSLKLPSGYTIEFDREAVKKAEALSGTIFLFFLALIFCYMIIAAANESFRLPLIILSTVPPSLGVPVMALVISGSAVNSAVCCSLIAVSGITVNAAVIVAGEFSELIRSGKFYTLPAVYKTVRRSLPCLLAVCGTTLAGTLPFLFLRHSSNSLISTLSMITFFGVSVSFISSLTLIPSLITKTYMRQKRQIYAD